MNYSAIDCLTPKIVGEKANVMISMSQNGVFVLLRGLFLEGHWNSYNLEIGRSTLLLTGKKYPTSTLL